MDRIEDIYKRVLDKLQKECDRFKKGVDLYLSTKEIDKAFYIVEDNPVFPTTPYYVKSRRRRNKVSKGDIKARALIIDNNGVRLEYIDKKYRDDEGFKYISNERLLKSKDGLYNLACRVKILDFKESSKIFGYKNLKKTMFEQGGLFQVNCFKHNYVCKYDNISRNVIEVRYNGKNYKFLASDLEIVENDLTLIYQGFNPTRDKTIRKGSEVRLVKNKTYKSLPRNSIGKVLAISKIGTVKYCTVEFNNKKYYINNNNLKLNYGNNEKTSSEK